MDCEGRVFISFIVEKDGTLSDKKIVKGLCEGFDEKAMEVINLMKIWQPGTIKGKAIRTLIIIPVSFKL